MMQYTQESHRTARLLDLSWRIANAPRQWSRKRLAAHYRVSERQITKDLDLLRSSLHLVIQRSVEGYYFAPMPRLPGTSFAFEEALALVLAARAGAASAGVEGEAFSTAIGRLESLFAREFRGLLRAVEAEAHGWPVPSVSFAGGYPVARSVDLTAAD